MDKSKPDWLRWTGALLSIALIALLLRNTSPATIWQMLQFVSFEWVLLGLSFFLLSGVVRATRLLTVSCLRWRCLFPMIMVVFGLSLANQLFPMRFGELSFLYLVRQIKGVQSGLATIALITARILDVFVLLVLLLLLIVLSPNLLVAISQVYVWVSVMGLMLLFVGGLGIIILRHNQNIQLAQEASKIDRFRWIPKKESINAILTDMRKGINSLSKPRRLFGVLLLSFVSWGLTLCMQYSLLVALGFGTSPDQVVLATVLASFTSMLPIGSMGSFGTLELGWAAGMMLFGMSREDAIASGFGTHILSAAYTLVPGLVGWAGALLRPTISTTQSRSQLADADR